MQEILEQNLNTQEPLTKAEIASQKKEKFMKLMKKIRLIIFAFLVLIIVTTISKSIFIKTKKIYTVEERPSTEPIVIIKQEEKPQEDHWEKYVSEKNRYEIMYPPKDKFEVSEDAGFIKIVYEETSPENNVDWNTLVSGYYATVNVIEIARRSISEAAQLKYDWYKNNCPQTAEFDRIADYTLNGANTKRFQIKNCNSDLIVIFANKDNLLYELTLASKGDIGFKQHLQSAINQIMNTFKIYFDTPSAPDPYITYENDKNKLLFSYPRIMDTKCCEVPIPIPSISGIEKVISIAEPDKKNTLGIFLDKNPKKLSYNDYVNDHANALVDDFKIIKGYSPTISMEESELNGHKLVKLSGYYWRGDDVYYLKSKQKDYYLIITKSQEFDYNVFYEIIDSIRFN